MSTLDWIVITVLVDVPLLAALFVAYRQRRRDRRRGWGPDAVPQIELRGQRW